MNLLEPRDDDRNQSEVVANFALCLKGYNNLLSHGEHRREENPCWYVNSDLSCSVLASCLSL